MKTANPERERVSVTERIPEHILRKIDASLVREGVPVSHNHWIIEALVEKLKEVKTGDGENGAQ